MPIDPHKPHPDHNAVRLLGRVASREILNEYARIPIAFEVHSRLLAPTPGMTTLDVEDVRPPYTKDYDALPGQSPADWPKQHDVAKWYTIFVLNRGSILGGAIVIPAAASETTATLWDLRVHPAVRRRAIGSALFNAATQWAHAHNHVALTVETQDNNVPACRFYAARGCTLTHVVPRAYPQLPDESRLIWRKSLV